MKKSLITISIFLGLLIFPVLASGQTTRNPEVRFGVKAGGNISLIVFDSTINQTINPGFVGGLSLQHLNQRNLGIQLELNYLQGGWKEKIDSNNKYQRRLHYIQVPFMTHARIGKGKLRTLIHVGPYMSVLLAEQKKASFEAGFPNQDYYWRDLDNRFDFGFCLGLGLSLDTDIGLFQLEGRANYGLTNTFERPPETEFITSNNLAAELSICYHIEAGQFRSLAGKILFWR